MELRRWTNPHQPQTLYLGVVLLYVRAVLGLFLSSSVYGYYWGLPAHLLASVAMVLGGLGIANEKRWGYRLAVAVTAVGLFPLLVWLLRHGPGLLFEFWFIMLAMFPIAQFLLLLHPMSREHQRIWFT